MDQIKRDFVDQFGILTAKRLCAYGLYHWDQSLDDGFTEGELEMLGTHVAVAMMMFLWHRDVTTEEPLLAIRVTDDNNLRAWALDATQ